MANLITSIRLMLCVLLVYLISQQPASWHFFNVALLITIYLLDGVDGYVARRLGETSLFGASYDVLADRSTEMMLWFTLSYNGLVPLWVAITVLGRGLAVDGIRVIGIRHGIAPFDLPNSMNARFLVASRLMRFSYGTLKGVTFAWLITIPPIQATLPQIWQQWQAVIMPITDGLIYLTLAVCLLRGLPVIYEFLLTQRYTTRKQTS